MLWQLKDKYLKTLYLLLWSNRITAGTSLNLWEAKFLRLNQIKSKVDVLSREKSSFSSQRKQNKKPILFSNLQWDSHPTNSNVNNQVATLDFCLQLYLWLLSSQYYNISIITSKHIYTFICYFTLTYMYQILCKHVMIWLKCDKVLTQGSIQH